MVVIGLMGAIGAGKSTVAGLLGELGAAVHDADRAVHEAWGDPEVRREAAALLGADTLLPTGEVDRAKVAGKVFGQPEALAALERILHPRARARMDAFLKEARARRVPAAVLDVPLLAETGLQDRCDVLLFIDAPEHVRRARLASRGWPPGEAARREARQMPADAKRAKAHAVVTNGGNLDETRRQLTEFWKIHVTPHANQGGPR